MIDKAVAFLKKYGHKVFTFTVGLVFIGAVFFAVIFAANKVYRVFVPDDIYTESDYAATIYGGSVYEVITDDSVEQASAEFFENYIDTFIKQDMPDFDDPMELNDEYIISYGIWQAITLNNTQGIYTYDSNNSFRIPKSDVEQFSLYCFDFARKFDHRTVEVCGKFRYNILNKTYNVPAAGIHSYLVPDVLEVEQGENDTYILTVDCYEVDMMSTDDPTSNPQNFIKRVKITLQDMGIQNYAVETGKPVPRYMFLSMDTIDETLEEETPADKVEDTVELN